MMAKRDNITAVHIPYKGADALNDLLAGRVDFMFATIPSVMAHIQSGRLLADCRQQCQAVKIASERADHDRKRLCRF